MTFQDTKVQQAINTIEPLVTAAQTFLADSDDKSERDKVVEIIGSWQLIINQCEIASDARNAVSLLMSVVDNDMT